MTQSVDISKHSEKHKPEVNLDPDSSSSDLSESLSSDSRAKKKNRTKKKKRRSIRKMTRPTHLRAMIMIFMMTVIIDVNDAKIRYTGNSICSDYAQL